MGYTDVLELRRFGRRNNVKRSKAAAGPDTGAAQLLAYLASAPLIAAALVIVAGGERVELAAYFMTLYGATLIIFFGGVRWGVAVMKEGGPSLRALFGAGLPLMLALPILTPIGGLYWKFAAIMAVIALLLVDDLKATRRGSGAPHWYLAVRLPLTVLVELAFIVAIVGAMR
ncbi:DUF3429 domain-containing protein [Hyphococcus sp.]|uniref:DUF3429 domain-containing protein n=1 Tax=Hyphococcus sp. TaxID=2038636 RepID=UPI0035C77659